jgi:16S rRNA (cytosine967-C5)-methyltransferase
MMSKKNTANIRRLALELLGSYEAGEKYVNLVLNSPSLKGLSGEDMGRLTALLYTAVERKITYDYLISALSGRSIDKISPKARNILRLGLCQILHMDKIPDFASVNETVKLAGSKSEQGFVNAILRKAVKEKGNLPYPKREKSAARYLSVMYSVPQPTVKFFIRQLGEEGAEELLRTTLEASPLSLTVNTALVSREELMTRLSSLEPKMSKYTENGIIINKKIPPKNIDGFDRGEFFIQDESSRIAVQALGIKRGMSVIDLCAAPGGKSFGAAIAVGKEGAVYSRDLHESKLSLIKEGASRLSLGNIKVEQGDATAPDEALFGKMDRVICDVPCSGLGVFSKKPDLRYKDISTTAELPPLQYSILEAAAKYLKPGGRIAYSTCTLNPAENGEVTDKFIEAHPEFSYESFKVGELSADEGKITLYPHIHGTDGFYIALMRKSDD